MIFVTMFDMHNNSRKFECEGLNKYSLNEKEKRSSLDKEIISYARNMCQEGSGDDIRVYVHDDKGVICEYFIQFDRLTYTAGDWENPLVVKNSKPGDINLFNDPLVIDEKGNITLEPEETQEELEEKHEELEEKHKIVEQHKLNTLGKKGILVLRTLLTNFIQMAYNLITTERRTSNRPKAFQKGYIPPYAQQKRF